MVVTDEETVFIAQQSKEQVDSEVRFAECRKRLYSKFRGNTTTHYGRQSQITISNLPTTARTSRPDSGELWSSRFSGQAMVGCQS